MSVVSLRLLTLSSNSVPSIAPCRNPVISSTVGYSFAPPRTYGALYDKVFYVFYMDVLIPSVFPPEYFMTPPYWYGARTASGKILGGAPKSDDEVMKSQ